MTNTYHEFGKMMIIPKYVINKIGLPKKSISLWDKKKVICSQPNCISSALIQYRDVHLPLRHRNVVLELSYIYLQYPSRRKNERPTYIYLKDTQGVTIICVGMFIFNQKTLE